MEKYFYVIQIVSTLSIVPAVILGSIRLRTFDTSLRLFYFFLWAGFLTDLFGWYAFLTGNGEANEYVRAGYSLLEAVFVFWFVGGFMKTRFVQTRSWLIVVPVWIIALFVTEGIKYFLLSFEIIISFLISFSILNSVEREDHSWGQLHMWLLLGLFLNYFCTFFFMAFLDSTFGAQLWFLRNLIAAAANLIFAWGYFSRLRQPEKDIHATKSS